jgi:hypothetical protein
MLCPLEIAPVVGFSGTAAFSPPEVPTARHWVDDEHATGPKSDAPEIVWTL